MNSSCLAWAYLPEDWFLSMHLLWIWVESNPNNVAGISGTARLDVIVHIHDFACQTLSEAVLTLSQVGLWARRLQKQSDGKNQKTMPGGLSFSSTSPTMILITDTSGISWGAHMDHQQMQRTWSPEDMGLHVSVLGLRAIMLACMAFLPFFKAPQCRSWQTICLPCAL